MTNKVYIARNYRSKFDAAGKAKMDCETILENNGWKNIGFKQTWISNSILGTLISALGVTWALLRLKSNSLVCLQYPFNKFYGYCLWGAKVKNCEVVTIVHDLKSLKGKYGHTPKEIELLKQSQKLIVHNDIMKKWCEEQGINGQIETNDAFDYLHTSTIEPQRTPINYDELRVVFAGNMGNFIYEMDNLERGNFKMDLYGVGYKEDRVKDLNNTILDYKGMFPADQVIDRVDGDFGLVWYGEGLDTCDGVAGQYLKFNNPHKLSMYLLCDMPIIIWDKAAMAKFVEEKGIGITISSLRDIKPKLEALTPEQIDQMRQNVANIKGGLQTGQFLTEALNKLD